MSKSAPLDPRKCYACSGLELSGEKFKHCAACPKVIYCSRACQKSDWKSHKLECLSKKPAHSPGFHAFNSLLGLTSDDYLHKLPTELDVYQQLVDCFRMRVEDEYVFSARRMGIYDGDDPRVDFKKFLDLAEGRKGLLPSWWDKSKRMECEKVACDRDQFHCIYSATEKSDIQEKYDDMMPAKLRILGEKIYGKGFM